MSKKCINCGTEISDDSIICTKCGVNQEGELRCPKCKSILDMNSKFCTECGTKIEMNNESMFAKTTDSLRNFSTKRIFGKFSKFVDVIAGICIIVFALNYLGDVNIFGNSEIKVKAEDMVADYIRDTMSAEKKYKDQDVVITGKLIEKSQFGNSQDFALSIYRQFAAGKRYEVVVSVPEDKVNEANKVRVGDIVTVTGECHGMVKQDDPTYIMIQVNSRKLN